MLMGPGERSVLRGDGKASNFAFGYLGLTYIIISQLYLPIVHFHYELVSPTMNNLMYLSSTTYNIQLRRLILYRSTTKNMNICDKLLIINVTICH